MLGNGRIIERDEAEVNGVHAHRRLAMAWTAMMVALGTSLWSFGCESPKRLYAEAQRDVREGRMGEAIPKLERIERDHGSSPEGARARRDLTLYRGLGEADRLAPMRFTRATLVSAARAVEQFHRGSGRWPPSLEAIVPSFLPAVPADAWGKPVAYAARPGGGYRLVCLGADGAPGGAGDAADLVVENGTFVQEPEGIDP